MTDVAITVLVLVVAVAAFVWNRLPVEIVALGVALALFGTGVISLDEAFSGFGSGTVVLIAALFVVAEGIDAAGITTWLGGLLIRFAGTSRVRLVLLMMGITALLTAFISVNGAVAALLPMVVVLAVRLGRRPAQLLMPMAFAAHAGSLLVLTGSPVNILILNAALDSTGRGIGFFEFGLVGLPLLVGTIGLAVWLGPKLLPDRTPDELPKDLSSHGETLMHHYLGDDQLSRLTIPEGSALIGLPAQEPLGEHPGALHPISVQRPDGRPVSSAQLSAGDQIIVRGEQRHIDAFAGLKSIVTGLFHLHAADCPAEGRQYRISPASDPQLLVSTDGGNGTRSAGSCTQRKGGEALDAGIQSGARSLQALRQSRTPQNLDRAEPWRPRSSP